MADTQHPARLAISFVDVELERPLGEGGEARVHESRYVGADASLRAAGPTAAKIFTDGRPVVSTIAAVNSLASLRRALDNTAEGISMRFNLPLRVIADGDDVVGYLLPKIGPPFVRTGATFQAERGAPRVAERLFLSRDTATSVGLCFATLAQRLTLCKQLAEAFELLHGVDYVYGDLSGRNVLYSLWPSPEIVLLDCESLRPTGSATSRPQLTTPDWTQAGRASLSQYTDQAKLSTFMLRALSPGVGAERAHEPSRLRGASVVGDDAGRLPEIFRRASGDVEAAEWVVWLSGALDDVERHEGWTRGRKGDWLRIK